MIPELSITITNNLFKEPKEATYNRKRGLTFKNLKTIKHAAKISDIILE